MNGISSRDVVTGVRISDIGGAGGIWGSGIGCCRVTTGRTLGSVVRSKSSTSAPKKPEKKSRSKPSVVCVGHVANRSEPEVVVSWAAAGGGGGVGMGSGRKGWACDGGGCEWEGWCWCWTCWWCWCCRGGGKAGGRDGGGGGTLSSGHSHTSDSLLQALHCGLSRPQPTLRDRHVKHPCSGERPTLASDEKETTMLATHHPCVACIPLGSSHWPICSPSWLCQREMLHHFGDDSCWGLTEEKVNGKRACMV